jgi:hypothetical protein
MYFMESLSTKYPTSCSIYCRWCCNARWRLLLDNSRSVLQGSLCFVGWGFPQPWQQRPVVAVADAYVSQGISCLRSAVRRWCYVSTTSYCISLGYKHDPLQRLLCAEAAKIPHPYQRVLAFWDKFLFRTSWPNCFSIEEILILDLFEAASAVDSTRWAILCRSPTVSKWLTSFASYQKTSVQNSNRSWRLVVAMEWVDCWHGMFCGWQAGRIVQTDFFCISTNSIS